MLRLGFTQLLEDMAEDGHRRDGRSSRDRKEYEYRRDNRDSRDYRDKRGDKRDDSRERGDYSRRSTDRRLDYDRTDRRRSPSPHATPRSRYSRDAPSAAALAESSSKRVLDTAIHPLLAGKAGTEVAPSAPRVPQAAISSTIANQRAGVKTSTLLQQERKKGYVDATAAFLSNKPDLSRTKSNPYVDRHLPLAPKRHGPRSTLHFHEKGTFEKEAEEMRAEAELAALQREVAESLSRVGVETEIVQDLLTAESMPQIDWWDVPFYGGESLMEGIDRELIRFDQIKNLIQRPALLPPPLDLNEVTPPAPLKLTKTEMKKLRRQRRLAEQKEKQEKIKLGLLPPDLPKVKIANIARILGAESVQEPSKVEVSIREQAANRHAQHLATNQQRSEEAKILAKEKAEVKKQESAEMVNVSVAVFKIDRLVAPQWKFKININAQQNDLTGCGVTFDAEASMSDGDSALSPDQARGGFSLVFVEGPLTGIRRFKHLLLERIRWTELPPDLSLPIDVTTNKCQLIWEGTMAQRKFFRFAAKSFAKEIDVKEYLSRFALDHFWRTAKDTI